MTDIRPPAAPAGKMLGKRPGYDVIALAALLAIGLMLAWWAIWTDRSTSNAGNAGNAGELPVRVVSGPAHDRVVVQPVVAAAPMPPVATAAPEMAQLTVNERSELLESRPRDPVWSAKTEAALVAQLRMSDVVPGAVHCADTLCSVQGTIPTAASSDRERIVDELVRGRLHAAYDRAGLVTMQAISIDADDAGTLIFTEYLRRK